MAREQVSSFYPSEEWGFRAIEFSHSTREALRHIFTDPELSETVRSINIGNVVNSEDGKGRRLVRVSFAKDYEGGRGVAHKFLFLVFDKNEGVGWKLGGYTKPRLPMKFIPMLESLPQDSDPDLVWINN